ncbi:MAG: hypothetical protein ACFFCS_08445 [Candidatus Hodarchaeota archaeon]
MNNQNLKANKTRGFANVIEQQLMPLNSNSAFKDKYKDLKATKFLLNPENAKFAALITVDRGIITVKSVENKPVQNLSKKQLGWNGFISANTQVFLSFALGKMSILQLLGKIITGDVKVKGITKLLMMKKMFEYLTSIK